MQRKVKIADLEEESLDPITTVDHKSSVMSSTSSTSLDIGLVLPRSCASASDYNQSDFIAASNSSPCLSSYKASHVDAATTVFFRTGG